MYTSSQSALPRNAAVLRARARTAISGVNHLFVYLFERARAISLLYFTRLSHCVSLFVAAAAPSTAA
jgi:uncharacterized membrane protein